MKMQCQACTANKDYPGRHYIPGPRCEKQANHALVDGHDLVSIRFVCGLHAKHHDNGFVYETVDLSQIDTSWYEVLIPMLSEGAKRLRLVAGRYRESALARDRQAEVYEQGVIALQRELGIR